MPHDELRNTIDGICARLQADLQEQMSALEAQQQQLRDEVRREAESNAAGEWAARLEQTQAESQQRMDAALAAAATDADRRVATEVEQVTSRLHEEMEQAVAAERDRLRAQLEAERTRAQKELAAERDRLATEIGAEHVKVKALTTALDESRALLAREREAAQRVAQSLEKAQSAQAAAASPAAGDESPRAIVEQLSAAVRSIAAGRSLSDTMSALVTAASAVAPRVALFVVNGRELQGWRAAGFADRSPVSLRLAADDTSVLGAAMMASGAPASTPAVPAPAFAALPAKRLAIAVPITVGGQNVAVLYADDLSVDDSQPPAAWAEAVQLLAAHASACLAYITALRTTQAIRAKATGESSGATGAPGTEEESSARRYARLLVSEIKLYNEGAVRVGRERRDLMTRLRAEIERARRLYEERVSTSVTSRNVYFQQELVHTLAGGDAALLGDTV